MFQYAEDCTQKIWIVPSPPLKFAKICSIIFKIQFSTHAMNLPDDHRQLNAGVRTLPRRWIPSRKRQGDGAAWHRWWFPSRAWAPPKFTVTAEDGTAETWTIVFPLRRRGRLLCGGDLLTLKMDPCDP